MTAPPSILFVTSTRVGDAILSTGLLDHLVRQHPGARVTVACGPAAAPLFEAVPGLERVIVLDKMVASLHWLMLWAMCTGRRWDVLVDLRNAPVTFLIPARRTFRVGRGRAPIHRVVGLGRVLGLDPPPAPTVWLSEAHRILATRLIPDGPLVLGLGPTANWRAKTWRAERFAELVERLTGPNGMLPGGRVAVFGRDDERPTVLSLIEAILPERRIDLAGRLDLLTVAACLGRCAFYVGNDSGLMHLAAAAGVPTLGLFGPTPDVHYAPWGERAAVVRTTVSLDEIFPKDFDHRTSDSLMDSLSVEAVEVAARALWARTRDAAAEARS
jgi:ADP-heptose:LPS heptosyltransferase